MIAKALKSTISLLNVINESVFKEQPSLFSGYLRGTKSNEESFLVQIIDRTESMLQRICFEIEKKGIKIIPHVFSGIPKKDILKFVKDNKIDLIAIGS